MEASSEQRQQLIESIFKRNYLRRKSGITPLDIDLAYARGLNRILRKNLTQNSDQPVLPTDTPGAITGEIIHLCYRRGGQGRAGSPSRE